MRLIGLVSLFLVACVTDARAYVDPGTGSYVLQIVIAGLVAGLFAIKTFWLNIVAFFNGILGRRASNRRDDA